MSSGLFSKRATNGGNDFYGDLADARRRMTSPRAIVSVISTSPCPWERLHGDDTAPMAEDERLRIIKRT